jgi:hypothetical protein
MNIKSLFLGLVVAAALSSTAQADLVQNGSLELSGYPAGTSPNIFDSGLITGWTLYSPGSNVNADYQDDPDLSSPTPPQSMPDAYRSCTAALGFQAGATCANPDGPGYFVNLDGDPAFPTGIRQSIAGLVANQTYTLTFSWAAVERWNDSGPTSDEYLTVNLGNLSFVTPNIFTGPPSPTCTTCLPPKGFSGWFTTSQTFVWDGSSNVLSFLSHGNPSGIPPTVNIDGISLNAASPEPSTWVMLITGFGVLVSAARRRRQTTPPV